MTSAQLYDDDGHYLPTDPEQDPAYPGQTPEPSEMAVVFIGMDPVPCARTFLRDAEPRHYDQVREMLRELPHRRLTAIVGHGIQSDSWMAANEGEDGHGSWIINRELPKPKRAPVVRKTPPQPLGLSAEPHDGRIKMNSNAAMQRGLFEESVRGSLYERYAEDDEEAVAAVMHDPHLKQLLIETYKSGWVDHRVANRVQDEQDR